MKKLFFAKLLILLFVNNFLNGCYYVRFLTDQSNISADNQISQTNFWVTTNIGGHTRIAKCDISFDNKIVKFDLIKFEKNILKKNFALRIKNESINATKLESIVDNCHDYLKNDKRSYFTFHNGLSIEPINILIKEDYLYEFFYDSKKELWDLITERKIKEKDLAQ